MPLMRTKFPSDVAEFVDLREVSARYILPGYAPRAPFLKRSVGVISIGSCFAEHIHGALSRAGVSSAYVRVEEVVNTPVHTDSILRRIVRGETAELKNARAGLGAASLLIVTLGVAVQSFKNNMPWFGAPRKADIPEISWRLLTVDEVAACARSIIREARSANASIHVALTVSPIPLASSVNHASSFGQDCLSKSILRVAVENVLNDGAAGISYWPSFEIIRWLGGHMGPFFGGDGADQRHVPNAVLDVIMGMFIEKYFQPEGA